MEPAATSGTFSDFKMVRGRKVAQIIIEVPIEAADAALRSLGGLPNPAEERWVALALMSLVPVPQAVPVVEQKALPAPDRKRWGDMLPAQQAAIRCGEPEFQRFLAKTICRDNGWAEPVNSDEAAQVLRHVCKVESRSVLNHDADAEGRWKRLENDFWAWQRGFQ